jgi:hypothetical protein
MSKTYNSKQVTLSWGPYDLTLAALATGEFVNVNPSARRAAMSPLLGGGGVVNMQNDTTGTVTVTLTAAGDVNDQLSEVLQEQLDSGIPEAHSLLVKDHSGRTVVACDKSILDGWPQISYTETVPTVQWVFLCPDLKMFVGGSNDL